MDLDFLGRIGWLLEFLVAVFMVYIILSGLCALFDKLFSDWE